MNIDISTRHTDLTDGIKDYILERGQRIERYFGAVTRCEVVLDRVAGENVVEIKVHAPRKSDLTSRVSHEDMHAAIDLAMDKIQRQVRRLKSKFKEHHRGEKNAVRVARDLPREVVEETYEDIVKEEL